MRSSTVILSLAVLLAAPIERAASQDPLNDQQVAERWTSEELENLLAPIALYPDPILAQVLIAATFPDQIAEAAAYVRTNGTRGIDDQTWEISVKAVARYAPVLNLMAEGEDWTIALGQAYASQPADVMNAVQGLRRMANAQGNLESTLQQTVYVEKEVIKIIPAEPKVIYVPTYDPAVVYFRPVYIAHAHPAYWSWGVGYPIGVWLTYDFDWYSHRIYYHGWHGPRWVVVSRPWIVISPIYVAPRHTVIYVNRGIGHRRINYDRLRRHTVVHRRATFDRRREWDRGRDWDRGRERDRAGNDRYDRRDNDRYDRRDDDRTDRRDGRRGQTVTPARGNIVPTRTWASRNGTTLSTRTSAPSAAPSRQTPGGSPRRGNTPGTADRSSPRAPSRGATPRATTAPDRIVKAPAWSSGRTPGGSTARPRASTSTRTTTAPRSAPTTTSRPSASPSTQRKRIVPSGRAGSARNSAPAPRASSRPSRSSSPARASSPAPRSSSTPRAASGSRRSGSSAPARSSGRSSGERRRP